MMIDLDAIRRALTTDFQSLWKENERLRAALREIIQIATPDHEEARHKAIEIARTGLREKNNDPV